MAHNLEFQVGDEILLRVTFTDRNGDPVDPSTEIEFRLQPPGGASVVSKVYNSGAGDVTRESQGVYSITHLIAAAGAYSWRAIGTGTNTNASTPNQEFLAETPNPA